MADPDILQLERTKSVKFRPWIGEGYGKGNELGLPARLLILGESHYKWEGMPKLLKKNTEAVVQNYLDLDKGWGGVFFTKVVHTILGPDTAIEQKKPFFHSIAFYNFVQRLVDGPRKSPTPEMWEKAAAPFRATLECLRPTHIVALGKRNWHNMPSNYGFWAESSEELISWLGLQRFPTPNWRPEEYLGFYRHSKGQSIVLAIYHPSWTRFQPSTWHPWAKRFLKFESSPSTHSG